MKKLNKYIMLFVATFALVSCVDDVVDTPTTEVSAKVGDEVKFGVSLPSSRTIYDGNVGMGSTTFPIYWVENDKVQIYSPQALEKRNKAEYKVVLPANVANPNYAEDLVITGDHGIQWGEGDKNNKYTYTDADGKEHTVGGHDFYSVYPSGNYEFDDDEGESDMLAKGVSVSDYQALSYVDGKFVHPMSNCLMTAVTPMDEVNYESGVVNLSYKPASTVLWVKLSVDKQDQVMNPVESYTIQGIKLKATSDIAGTFDLNLAENVVENYTGGKDVINVAFTNNYTIKRGDSIEFPIFLAPYDGLNLNGWTITVSTLDGDFTMKFTGDDSADLELVPGQVHMLTLPPLLKPTSEWDVSKWMTYIPRNVYLSEISIPGSWNSLNVDSQGSNPTIAAQYSNGVRAFHFDTRWKRTGSYNNYTYELGIAVGGDNSATGGDEQYMLKGATFAAALTQITNSAQADEYMVVICSFAQSSAQHNGPNGWIEAISSICSSNSVVYDAKQLTKDTLVGDVLGKVIVIINSEGELASVPSGSKCLFVNMPMTLSSDDFSGILNDRIGAINKGTANSSTATVSDISMYHTHAQLTKNQDGAYTGRGQNGDRGYVPSKGQRMTEINNILNWSKNNYSNPENYGHDKWIYLGVGGYYGSYSSGIIGFGASWKEDTNAHSTIASDFNTHINSVVTAMDAEGAHYYPVGIVLMNNVNGDTYKNNIKNILLLNNKYRLQYDPNKDVDYNPNSNVTPDSDVNQGGTII